MGLQIQQQPARIGLIINHPHINLETRQSQLRIHASEPEIRIESPHPKIIIDQTECFKSYFKMNLRDFGSYCSSRGKQACLEGIRRRVEEGDILGAIGKGGSIANIAAQKLNRTREFTIKSLPEHPPEITAIVEPVKVDCIPGSVSAEVNPGSVNNHFQWGEVQVYLQQQNAISIRWVDPAIDKVV